MLTYAERLSKFDLKNDFVVRDEAERDGKFKDLKKKIIVSPIFFN